MNYLILLLQFVIIHCLEQHCKLVVTHPENNIFESIWTGVQNFKFKFKKTHLIMRTFSMQIMNIFLVSRRDEYCVHKIVYSVKGVGAFLLVIIKTHEKTEQAVASC